VGGAEGSVWLAVCGSRGEMDKAEEILRSVSPEPLFDY
jgi:hypothetical protein